MLRSRFAALAIATACFGVLMPANSASASETNFQKTLTSQDQVLRLLYGLSKDARITGYGCLLGKVVSQVISASKSSKLPSVTVARSVLAVANQPGSEYCKATLTVAKTMASVALDYATYGYGYATQTYWETSYRKFGVPIKSTGHVKRQIGQNANRTVTYIYTFSWYF